jgi:hypothetical protein
MGAFVECEDGTPHDAVRVDDLRGTAVFQLAFLLRELLRIGFQGVDESTDRWAKHVGANAAVMNDGLRNLRMDSTRHWRPPCAAVPLDPVGGTVRGFVEHREKSPRIDAFFSGNGGTTSEFRVVHEARARRNEELGDRDAERPREPVHGADPDVAGGPALDS